MTKVSDAAALLGRLGGKKGGKARAAALTETQRQKIARKGGKSRAKNMTAAERSAAARNATNARWGGVTRNPQMTDTRQEVKRIKPKGDDASADQQ